MDEEQRLWQQFLHSGRVADYLRYRGWTAPGVTDAVREEQTFGERDKTASDHRGADSAGISQYRGE